MAWWSPAADALQLDPNLAGRTRTASTVPAAKGRPLFLRFSRELARIPSPTPRRRYPFPTETVIVTLAVNAVSKGDRYVKLSSTGEFLAKVEDLREAAYLPQGLEVYEIDGDEYVALRTLPSSEITFDEATLTLRVKLAPEGFPPQVYDLRSGQAEPDIKGSPTSLLVNYRLAHAGASGQGTGTTSLALDTAVSYASWLLRNQSFHSRSPVDTSHTRLETQLIRDDRENLRRLVLGDAFTPGQVLGSAVPFAGITFEKSYLMAPGFNRHPAVGYRGFADYPSQVDFYVGNTLVTRQQVAPGPFDIRNFNYYGGRRDVRVVVRDVFGREQTIAYPFYFTTLGLARGLHDYSYQAGWIRENVVRNSPSYGQFMASAFHQYGFSDDLTLGLRGEATSEFGNAGPAILYRSELTGQWGAHLGASYDRERRRWGHATSFSHGFQLRDFSSYLLWQRYADDYRILDSGTVASLPRQDFTASVGYTRRELGSVSVAFTRLQLRERDAERSVSVSYSKAFLGRFHLSATLRRNLDQPRGHEFFVGLQYLPTSEHTVNLTGNRDIAGNRTIAVNASNSIPVGEGLAYSFTADRREPASGSVSHSIQPRLAWYTRHGTVGGELLRVRGDDFGGSTAYTGFLQGSLVAAGGRMLLTRPVTDSFAIVQVTPPLEGIRIYENSQEVGRTDGDGRILLPNVHAYATNAARIQDKDVPIEYAIDPVMRTFSPPARSGTYVEFNLTRIRAFMGRFVFRAGDEILPLIHNLVTFQAGGKSYELPTAKDGGFYVENIPPGRHRAAADVRGQRCEFDLVVPAGDEQETQMGIIEVCRVDR